MNAILVNVNLKGALGGPVAHKDIAILETMVSCDHKGVPTNPHKVSAKCLHTERELVSCKRKFVIAEEIVEYWLTSVGPDFRGNEKEWRKLSPVQKINWWVNTYDEGFGVNWESL